MLEVLGLFIIQGLGALRTLCLWLLLLWTTLLELLLVVAILIFFYIFGNGAVRSPSILFHLSWCCCTGGRLFLGLGLYLYGGFGPWGASANWDVFEWWGLFSEVPSGEGFWSSEFVGALRAVWGGCVVTLLDFESGLATTFTLYFLGGMSLFLFSVAFVSFLTWGLVSGWVGLDWLDWGWNFGPNFPSNSR